MSGGEAPIHKVLLNGFKSPDVVDFGSTFHWSGEDGVTVIDVTHQDVFVTQTGGDGEEASEICGDFRTEVCDS